MNKSLLAILVFSLLTACETVPEAKYRISDYDIQQWILRANTIEQCLYPKEYQKGTMDQFANLSRNEQELLRELKIMALDEIVGQKNSRTIMNDYRSKSFFDSQHRKFNHFNTTNLDKKWCNNLRKNYRTTLKNIEKQQLAARRQAEKERKARDAFYATPQGQAALAQQQMQQQQMAHQAYLQHQQMRHQQEMQEQQMRHDRQMQQQRQIERMRNSIQNSMPRRTDCTRMPYGDISCTTW